MSPTPLVVVGDALLDRDLDGAVRRLAPDAPVPVVDDPVVRSRPGGAALAATLAARDGHHVVLVTALGRDAAGRELAALLSESGVLVEDIGLTGDTPEKVRILAHGRPMMRVDRGAPTASLGPLTGTARAAVQNAAAVLVSDYGRGITADGTVRQALAELPARSRVVWDPHPRGTAPVGPVTLATPNQRELEHFTAVPVTRSIASVAAAARTLARRWRVTVCVTCGDRGALAADAGGTPIVVPAPQVSASDACGAGDRFAAAAVSALSDGAVVSEAVDHAVRAATVFVAGGGAASIGLPDAHHPRPSQDAAWVVQQVRDRGGTVVAAGGCFDILHAGHVATLQAARHLGDCLVVLLNSDASVRRLKGPDRPVQPQGDRAAVLRGLDCVDAVEVFDEDTPAEMLRSLRPHLFAKGGDYTHAELPEGEVLDGWGGQAVVLPYLPGRSTTRLLEEVRHRG